MYDVDGSLNIGGITVEIDKLGFMEPNVEQFGIDMSVRYTRGGDPIDLEVEKIEITLDQGYVYILDSSQRAKFTGYYTGDSTKRAVVLFDDVPREIQGHFEIQITIIEIEGSRTYPNIFTFPYNLK